MMKWFRMEGEILEYIEELRKEADNMNEDTLVTMVEGMMNDREAEVLRAVADRLQQIIDGPAPTYNVKIPDYGDVMTVEEWRACVESGYFIDDDGIGAPAKDGMMMDDRDAFPSGIDDIPEDATHIVWFNK
jgi:hypothetical protein